jgi:hypothetical protein
MNADTGARNIIYLDYDGVLHDEEVYWHPNRGVVLDTPGRTMFGWESIRLELLMPYPNVRIVLSTSWVPMRSYHCQNQDLIAGCRRS